MGFDDLGPFVRRVVGQEMSRRRAIAEVVSKIGTQVIVQRLGASVTEGPYATLAGVSGFVRVGDRVPLVEEGGTFIVGMPVDGAARSNILVNVGNDPVLRATTSVSTYVELQSLSGLAVADPAFVLISFSTQAEAVGGTGAAEKQVRFVVNGLTAHDVNVGTGGNFYHGGLAFIFPRSGSPARRVVATLAQGVFQATVLDVGEVTTIALQGRTNDSAEANDILRAQNLIAYS